MSTQINNIDSISALRSAISIAIIGFSIVGVLLLHNIAEVNFHQGMRILWEWFVNFINRSVGKLEKNYNRDVEIGKLHEKTKRRQLYRFVNDLIIDLGLKRQGATPYEFMLFVVILVAVGNTLACWMIFKATWVMMSFVLYPVVLAGVFCVLYTRANLVHDMRITAIIESENIISNDIKNGVEVAVRNNLSMFNSQIQPEYQEFLDNLKYNNYHIATALLELNNNLGSISDDFIKKCIVYEMEESEGLVGMFRDVVVVNNIKTKQRLEMKLKFEQLMYEFIISFVINVIFLGALIAIYPNVYNFYVTNVIGNLVLAFDAILFIGVFVYITYLRARDI